MKIFLDRLILTPTADYVSVQVVEKSGTTIKQFHMTTLEYFELAALFTHAGIERLRRIAEDE